MISDEPKLHKAKLEINDSKLVVQLLVLLHTETKHSNQLLLVPLISTFLFHLISQSGQNSSLLTLNGRQNQLFFSSEMDHLECELEFPL
ncbi:hypothetical protein IC582_005615 [Cucumis melo]